jgi:PAS domain S-box-containing protein
MDKGKYEEQRYRAIFENMRNGVAVFHPVDDGRDFVFRDFNKAGERLDGVRKSDLIGKRLLDVFLNADEFGVLASLQRTHQTGEPEYLPASYYRDEHREGWRENFICKLPDGDIVAIYNDITERKRFEENIVEREQKFKAITDSVLDAIILINEKGEISFWNPASERIFGYKSSEAMGKNVHDLLAPPEYVQKNDGDI